jgi:hypothetical protein
MLCKRTPSPKLGFRSQEQNKHQLLHRIASVKTPLIYNNINDFFTHETTSQSLTAKIEKQGKKSFIRSVTELQNNLVFRKED